MLGLLQVDTSNILDKVSSNQSSSWLYHALPASPPSLLFQLYVCVCVCVYIYIYIYQKKIHRPTQFKPVLLKGQLYYMEKGKMNYLKLLAHFNSN